MPLRAVDFESTASANSAKRPGDKIGPDESAFSLIPSGFGSDCSSRFVATPDSMLASVDGRLWTGNSRAGRDWRQALFHRCAKLGQCLVLNLPRTFFGDADDPAHLFERQRRRVSLRPVETPADHRLFDIRQIGQIAIDDRS